MVKKSFLLALGIWGFVFLLVQDHVFASGKKLILGDGPLDITTLPTIQGEHVLEVGDMTQITQYYLDPENCQLFSFEQGFSYVKIKGQVATGKSEEPLIPMKVIKVELPQHTKLCGVRILAGKYREIKNALHIMPMPEQKEWRPNKGGLRLLSYKNEVYESEYYYPGTWLSCDGGSDGNRTIAFVRIFPLQHVPSTKQGVLLTEATIEISYRIKIAENQQGFSPTQSESIIICPEAFLSAANDLKSLHDSLGVSTEIYTVESIDTTYSLASESHFIGYATCKPYQLHTYNYELARKIIKFLADAEQHPELQYITLLGSGHQVPPSYYFTGYDYKDSFWYDSHNASDFLYASPDDDQVPNYQIGRIPARSLEKVQGVIEKIKNWCQQKDFSWFNKVAITGGQPFNTEFFYGELITLDAINRDYLQGMQISKFYETDQIFSRDAVIPVLQNGQFGFLYQISHGSGDALYYDDDTYISSVDLLNFHVSISRLPIVVSVACNNAAFDTDVIAIPYGAPRSFGEAILLSPAGGIAYLGGSRSNYGIPAFYFDQGNVVIEKEPYMVGMLTHAFHTYHEGANHLGELYTDAIEKFIEENNMSDEDNQGTMFRYTLLGDPVLLIPVQDTSSTTYKQSWLVTDSCDYMNANGIPTYVNAENKSIILRAESNSPAVSFKYMKFEQIFPGYIKGKVLESDVVDATPPFEYQFTGKNGFNYLLLRAKTEDEKEGWLYHYTTDFHIAVDGTRKDWEATGLEPVAVDPKGTILPVQWDLHRLYATDDDLFWYFGFDANFASPICAVGLAIDTKPGGYVGIQGQDIDAFDNYITFDENYGVDYQVYLWKAEYQEPVIAEFKEFGWGGDLLARYKTCFAVYDADSQFVEVMVAKEDLDNVSQMNVILLSSFSPSDKKHGPAIDSVPSDTVTYTGLYRGSTYANTLSNFVTIFSKSIPSAIVTNNENQSADYILFQNYPNPFNTSTLIRFHLPISSDVSLKIFNTMGQEIETLMASRIPAGNHEFQWDGSNFPSGVYFYRLQAGTFVENKKLILLK